MGLVHETQNCPNQMICDELWSVNVAFSAQNLDIVENN